MSEMKMLFLLVGFIGILIMARVILFFRAFNKELRYLNAEIRRSSESELHRWKRARRRLWLSLIPFYNPRKKRTHH